MAREPGFCMLHHIYYRKYILKHVFLSSDKLSLVFVHVQIKLPSVLVQTSSHGFVKHSLISERTTVDNLRIPGAFKYYCIYFYLYDTTLLQCFLYQSSSKAITLSSTDRERSMTALDSNPHKIQDWIPVYRVVHNL